MSEEMAVGDNASSEDPITNSKDTVEDIADALMETKSDDQITDAPKETKEEDSIKPELEEQEVDKPDFEDNDIEEELENIKRGIKRRASTAFSDELDTEFKGFDEKEDSLIAEKYAKIVAEEDWKFPRRPSLEKEDFKGFDDTSVKPLTGYDQVLGRLEQEVSEAVKNYSPLRNVMATMPPPMGNKPMRQDTDSSRPSSALSSRSDGDSALLTDASSSPVGGGRRRPTTEMSSPLLRVPLERGWKRELVYRAALDQHSRRNADIYYYSPTGKKLRSTREVSEHLSGTGLSLENFSFFKEPLGLDDPEKEIIRDAKIMRRVESPVQAPPQPEGKRTPKPKPPKEAVPEPPMVKSPPSKLKVKSMGSRLNNNGTPVAPKQQRRQSQQQTQPPATPAADNNNTAAWKKPRAAPAPGTVAGPRPVYHHRGQLMHHQQSDVSQSGASGSLQPCSMSCGRGAVPSLACAACLCLYHPACLGLPYMPPHPFFCKNCDSSSPNDPPTLIHKSGVTTASGLQAPTPLPADTVPVPRRVPVPAKVPKDKRVLLRMKMSGGADGQKVWAVSPSGASGPQHQASAGPVAPAAPVPSMTTPISAAEKAVRGRLANGAAASPAGAASPGLPSPRRRGRPKSDDTDTFTAFHKRAHEKDYNVALQIFQYMGMRDLARCARVCKLWHQLTCTPQLWRHVRMKNSHVSDWGGLCAALKKHGTKWLDLRKMLLPTDDTVFWDQFIENISSVDTLERLELCRCPARVVEGACRHLPALRALAAPAIRDTQLDPQPLSLLPRLELLRLKSLSGLSLRGDLRPLSSIRGLQHLSLTSIKELGWCACEVVGQLEQLESLELGECSFGSTFAAALARLVRLRRLRLERGVPHGAAAPLLKALASLPALTRLELVNFDVKVGFDDALAECKNIQRLLIIPTYVSQSATTNKQVLSGVLRLKDTLTHLMWGVTIELLRVTELFIDQCEAGGEGDVGAGPGAGVLPGPEGHVDKRRELGECIPVLKPVPGCRLPDDLRHVAGPPQVEILPIPTLQRLLSAQLPNTKLKLLRIPFHATWRQTLADFH